MTTFAESYDSAGKTIHPVTTYAMSGLGSTEQDYAVLTEIQVGRELLFINRQVR